MKAFLSAAAVLAVTASSPMAAELTVITAGDQNMVDYINEYLGPLFEAQTRQYRACSWYRTRGCWLAEDP